MTMTLQQYKDGVWSDVKAWSQDFTGAKVHALEKGHYVPSGHRYRVVTVVQIFNSNGKVLETVACDSPIKDY